MQTIEHVGQAPPAPRPPSMDPDSSAARAPLDTPVERLARPSQGDRPQSAGGVAKVPTGARKPVSYGAGF